MPCRRDVFFRDVRLGSLHALAIQCTVASVAPHANHRHGVPGLHQAGADDNTTEYHPRRPNEFRFLRGGVCGLGMRARAGYSAAAYSPEPHEMAGAAGHRPRHTRWAVAAVDCFLPRPATAVGDEALRQWASAVDASMDSVSDAANGGGCNSLIDEG